MSIEKNIEDREWFDAMVEERGEAFWSLCREKLLERMPDNDSDFMSQSEVEQFENSPFLAFGIHAKKMIREIPISYLEFVSNNGAFYKKLRRYLRTVER